MWDFHLLFASWEVHMVKNCDRGHFPVRIFLSDHAGTVTLAWVLLPWVFFSFEGLEKITRLFTGLGSVRIVKNCDLGLENAILGQRPRAASSRPRSQFFTIWTSQPANNIHVFYVTIEYYLLKSLRENLKLRPRRIGESLLTSLFTFLLICIGLYVQKETC